MNGPIRKLSVVAMVMFAALLINLSVTAVFRTDSLMANSQNRRARDAEFAQDRGAILVGNTAIAITNPSKDSFKYQRSYPQGPLYAPVTGYYSYLYASSGLEASYNRQLAGTSDSMFLQHLIDLATGRKAAGATIETTLNAKAQRAAFDALGDNTGAVVALNYSTGEILAMASTPTYNPNQLATHDIKASQAAWKELNAATGKPMSNRAAREIFPPGSTFKLVTAAAALENGWQPGATIDSPASMVLPGTSSQLPNTHDCGGDKITLDQALQVSCNTAFANLGKWLGADKLREQARRFGFNSTPLPELNAVASRFPSQLDVPQTMMSAIGQYEVSATPLQMAMVGAAIANNGVLMRPHLVKTIRGADLQVIQTIGSEQLSTPMSPQNAGVLKGWMYNVVEKGTGTTAQVDGVHVGGKSGTAQSDKKRPPYAWFVAFADDPQVVVCAFVQQAADTSEVGGSTVAGPIAAAVIESLT